MARCSRWTAGRLGDLQLPRHQDDDYGRRWNDRHRLLTTSSNEFRRCAITVAAPRIIGYFVTDEIGYKYRIGSLPAAFGRAQLARIDELVGKKKQIFNWYEERLADVPGIQLNVRPVGAVNTFWMVTVVVDGSYGLDDSADDRIRSTSSASTPVRSSHR